MNKLLNSIAVVALAIGLLVFPASAQTTTACTATAPATTAERTFSGGAPYDGFQAMYHQAWQFVRDNYYDPSKLTNWAALEHKFDDKLSSMDDLHLALKLMSESLGDKWTTYISPADNQAAMIASRTPTSGLEVRQRGGKWTVDVIHVGSPAYGTAIRERDVVVCVNDVALDTLTKPQVNQLLSGATGTKVTVKALNADNGQEYTVDLTLAATPRDITVDARLLPGNYVYMRLPTFDNEAAVAQFIAKFVELSQQAGGNVKGMVLDLRNNLGGELPLATKFASLFLADGQVVTRSVHRDGSTTDTNVLPADKIIVAKQAVDPKVIATLRALPVVVLINGSSASAAEITIGALKDNNRGATFGVTTFGKGVGYKIHRGPVGGFISLTGYKYVTPNKFDVHEHGIAPTNVVAAPRQAQPGVDAQFDEAFKHLQKIAP